jgi:hypothetical protein
MFEFPVELSSLTIAKKFLIQRVSPLIPVIHIKNGIMGSRGHIVSFFQDISSISKILPRLPSKISIIKVIRDGENKEGRAFRNNFIVNKNRVQNALVWLQKYSILYQKKN